ncbi:MAG TPA: hypothetical protein PLB36_06880 [Bacillota bacterium]|nr:hypothetical protein [Candidatus Fermentithermobacillaceae bacterium]HOB30748.1 hypothetical protein [Bacillota bacterium]HOK64869.1 hypothetical protein [Bacillota bacterium]HOL12588.1 hypothetical protein [Bacillota bacterium]HOQ03310.1 hypothetical protein [Bacillota bacterium]
MGSKTWVSVLILFMVAFAAQKVLSGVGDGVWFVSVFVVVYLLGKVILSGRNGLDTVYLEEIFFELVLCVALALMAWYLDGQISVYTGKSGGPAVPAVLFSLVEEFVGDSHS